MTETADANLVHGEQGSGWSVLYPGRTAEATTTLRRSVTRQIVAVWSRGGLPQKCKDATISTLHRHKTLIECSNCRCNFLLAHAGKVLVTVSARRLSACSETEGILSEEQCGSRPKLLSVHTMLVVH